MNSCGTLSRAASAALRIEKGPSYADSWDMLRAELAHVPQLGTRLGRPVTGGALASLAAAVTSSGLLEALERCDAALGGEVLAQLFLRQSKFAFRYPSGLVGW